MSQIDRGQLLNTDTVGALADIFKVLGDPTRVRILDVLSRGELCVCHLAGLLGLTESAVSHQLRLLRDMRIVKRRKAGKTVYYSLDDNHVAQLFVLTLEHLKHP